ncbi:MAG TPA: RDD family protein, partial [Solirubrobacteraceae bacterium]|nr:RDD family protein [Solirubrobacteraceae bacterium]
MNGTEDSRVGLDAVPALPEDARPRVARALSAGRKGAERVAHATGVDRMVDQAVEDAIVRALRSPTVIRAVERAIERDGTDDQSRDEIAHVVKRILASDVADQAWQEVLESEQTQKLVERIAGAPEIRAAIASQGAGLMTDIGVRLTIITEELDDALERVVRPRDPDSETDQAGFATRCVAAAIDLAILFAGYALIASVVSSLFTAVVGTHPSLVWLIVGWTLLVILAGAIFAGFWTLAGQTPGMRFLSIRLIARGSRDITFARALRRVLGALLSLLPLGLGYLAILRD